MGEKKGFTCKQSFYPSLTFTMICEECWKSSTKRHGSTEKRKISGFFWSVGVFWQEARA